METSSKTATLMELQVAAVRLSLFIRKYCTVHSRGACLFLTAYEALNLTSIALANPEYAWYSGVPATVWEVLRLVGQTATFAQAQGVPDYALIGSLLATLSLLLIAVCYLAWALARLQDFEFRRVLSGEKEIRFQPIARATILTCVILHEVMYIPCLDWLNQANLPLSFTYFVQIWLGVTVVGSSVYFSSYKLGSSTYNSMSCPCLALYGKLSYSLFVLGLALFSYSAHLVLHVSVYLVTGGLWLCQVFAKVPYQQELLNKVEIAKALLLTWTGVVLILADINTLAGVSFLLMHIILYFAWLLVVLTALRIYMSSIARKEKVTYDFELELRLRWHLQGKLYDSLTRKAIKPTKALRQELDTSAINSLCRSAYQQFATKPYTLMCFIEYFSILKEKTFVKILLCRLQTLPKDILSFIDVACCEYAVLNAFAAMKSDQEAIQYLRLFQHLKRVKEQDEELCLCLHRIVDLYEAPYFITSDLDLILKRVVGSLKRTKWTYESLAQVIGDNPVFGQLYAGFLRLLQIPGKAKDIEARLKHMKHEMVAKYRVRKESVFYFDQQNMVLLVSLHHNALGKVLVAKGAALLGFEDAELVDLNCKVIVPEMLRSTHSDHMQHLFSYRHRHIMYNAVHRLIVLDKRGFCHWAYWKNRLINYEAGRIGAFVAIRLVEEKEEFALIGQSKLTNMTEGFNKSISTVPSLLSDLESALHRPHLQHGEVLLSTALEGLQVSYRFKRVQLVQSMDVEMVTVKESAVSVPTKSFSGKSVGFEPSSPSNASNLIRDKQFTEEKTSSLASQGPVQPFMRSFLTSMRAFKLLIAVSFCSVLLGALAQTGLIIGIQAQVTDLNADISLIEDISDLRTALQRVALDSRELSLRSSGSFYLRNATELRLDLLSLEEKLGNLTLELLAEADAGIKEMESSNIDWWKLERKRGVLDRKNAIELASYLEMAVNRLLIGEDIEMELVSELVRNGPSETLRCIDRIINDRIEYHKSTFSRSQEVVIVPLFLLFYSLLTLLICLSAVLLFKLSAQRKHLLRQYAGLQTDLVLSFHTVVAGRLEQVHEYEYVPCRIRNGRKLSYSLLRVQKGVLMLAAVAFLVTIACFQTNYQLTYNDIQISLEKQPFVFQAVTSLKSHLESLLFWLREAQIQPSAPHLPSYSPDNHQAMDPVSVLTQLLQLLTAELQSLRGRGKAYSSDWDLTTAHFAFIYTSSVYVERDLHCGFYPALFALPTSVFSCVNSLSEAYSEACFSVEKTLFTLISLCETNQDFFHSSIKLQTSQTLSLSLSILSIYTLAALLFLLFLYIPTAWALLYAVKRELEVFILLVNTCETGKVTSAKASISSGGLGTRTPTVMFGP